MNELLLMILADSVLGGAMRGALIGAAVGAVAGAIVYGVKKLSNKDTPPQ